MFIISFFTLSRTLVVLESKSFDTWEEIQEELEKKFYSRLELEEYRFRNYNLRLWLKKMLRVRAIQPEKEKVLGGDGKGGCNC